MKEFIKDIVIAVTIVFIVMQFYEPTRVFGISMQPSFYEKDCLVLSREAYSRTVPKRGDVVVFQSDLVTAKGDKELLIKRVIGLPGDKVVIKGGNVYINNKLLPDYYTEECVTDGKVDVTVPAGSYFCMGDNRQHSTDSRFSSVGCVPSGEIKGKIIFRFFPFNKIGRIRGI